VEGEEAREEDGVIGPLGAPGVVAEGEMEEEGVELGREGGREGGKGG